MKAIMRNFRKHGFVYLAWFLAVALLWNWAFGCITSVKAEEKICIFIGTYDAAFDGREALNEPKNRPEYIKETEVDIHALGQEMFGVFLESEGYGKADILILPESQIADCALYCSPISEKYQEYFEERGSALGWYRLEDVAYGLKVYDRETHESLISGLNYLQGDGEAAEDFYLLFNRESLHLDDLSGKRGKHAGNAAILVAERLLSL